MEEERDRLQRSLFEYTINDQETEIYTVEQLVNITLEREKNVTSHINATNSIMDEILKSGKTQEYSHLIHFIAKGKIWLFTVVNGEGLIAMEPRKNRERIKTYTAV